MIYIYIENLKKLTYKIHDSDDDLTLLAEKLDISTQFDRAEIWIDEFSGFTPQQYCIIEKLYKRLNE